jgi:hypothetical protein
MTTTMTLIGAGLLAIFFIAVYLVISGVKDIENSVLDDFRKEFDSKKRR